MAAESNQSLYLALDQGGHASRAIVFDSGGVVQARALREVAEFHPRSDWVEQDPDELVQSLNDVILEITHELGPRASQLKSAGLATQRSSIVCWDRISGEALSPVLSWQDRRAHAWLSRFEPEADRIHRVTGLRFSAHYGASKLRWCLEHLPAVASAAGSKRLAFGPLAAFLVFRLTELRTFAVDPANAARTLLLGFENLEWNEGLLHLFGIPREALPDVVPTRFDFGHLAAAPHVPLAVVNGDQSAALFASGMTRHDTVYINMGTGAFAQCVTGATPQFHEQLLTGIVFSDGPERSYVLEGTVNGAGSALAWIAEKAGIASIEQKLEAWLKQEGEPPLFLNGVGGLGAPYWIADFESRFIGDAEPGEQAVAVAESVVFLLQASLDLMRQRVPALSRIVATGGLTVYDGLCQRISDLAGLPLYRPIEHEATARGTAWLLAGNPQNWPEPQPGRWFQPKANSALQARHTRWCNAMQAAIALRAQ